MKPVPDIESAPAPPRADAMIETLRSVGYSIEAAVADIVDNSISAQARRVEVWFEWKGQDSSVLVEDDGRGMSSEEIVTALRPGSRSPLDKREATDLGRFGLGLKTASFSQCRQLVVLSKPQGGTVSHWGWDLDYVSRTNLWNVLRLDGRADLAGRLSEKEHGTMVFWSKMDRVPGTRVAGAAGEKLFNEVAIRVKRHLGMVFHRFISSGQIQIVFNGMAVEPWNPFLWGAEGSQPLAEDRVEVHGVVIRPYVLPHHSKLSPEQHEEAGGIDGWTQMQGFYVYRNHRLLVAGGWLGLLRRSEQYKLARVLVDITNATDEDWHIDIKKATARPPDELREQLLRAARVVRSRAEEVFRHRGVQLTRRAASEDVTHLWTEHSRRGKRFFQINRDHPAVAALLGSDSQTAERTSTLLRLLEEAIPTPLIFYRVADAPDEVAGAFEGASDSDAMATLRGFFEMLRNSMSREQALSALRRMEPFASAPELVDRFEATL